MSLEFFRKTRGQGTRITGLAVMLLVGACTTQPQPAPELEVADPVVAEPSPAPVKKEPPAPEDYPVRPFEGDALYNLLVGEIAGYRSNYELALEKYLEAAEETRDAGVAARAARLALYLKKEDEALRAVRIWAQEEPDSIEAHRHAADLMLRAGNLEEAILHMEQVKNLGGMAQFDVFAFRAAGLPMEDKKSLLAAVTRMLERHPGDDQLMFSRAVLLKQTGQAEEALALTEDLMALSDNINVLILKLSLLNTMERTEEAMLFIRNQVALKPDNRRLRLMLARMLFEQRDLEAARAQYQIALQGAPNDGDILFALALISLEQKDDTAARKYLEHMVRWNRRAGEAHYYLGGIAERESDTATALREYRQVGSGYEFIPAQARIASLLAVGGQWEEAREHLARMRVQQPQLELQLIMVEAQLLTERGQEEEVLTFLDEAVEKMPENLDLLYFRAMTGQKFGRLDILERDLRQVIELDPGNSDALNALGYTLADQTDRHHEALELIEKALEIKPDEAAYIDSMGWVQYRLGNYEPAIVYLRRALSLFKNDEVAAHLGEVLWVSGEHKQASEVWDKALELAPDSEILKDVIQRFRN